MIIQASQIGSVSSVFTSALGPPLAIAAVGYLFGTVKDVDTDGLSAIAVYVLMPALVFETLVTLPIDTGTTTAILAAMFAFTAIMSIIGWAVSRFREQEGTLIYGALMAAAFPNTGNFGIPVATFAFGAAGRSTAVLFVLVQNLLLYTVGIFLLSKGQRDNGLRDALKRVATQPVTYAVVAAVTVMLLGINPPEEGTVIETIRMVGDASIPLFLLILGLQVAKLDLQASIRRTLPTVGLKLFIAPVVAAVVIFAIGVQGDAVAKAFLVLASGPSAVAPLVLSIEFDDRNAEFSTGDYVGSAVFLTLIGSLPVVTGLLLLTKHGLVV